MDDVRLQVHNEIDKYGTNSSGQDANPIPLVSVIWDMVPISVLGQPLLYKDISTTPIGIRACSD